jgi:hypothetical protein
MTAGPTTALAMLEVLMRPRVSWLLLSLLALSGAARPGESQDPARPVPKGDPPPIVFTPPPAVDGPRDPEALRTRWRWIGVAHVGRACPPPVSNHPADPDDWTMEPLFPAAGDSALRRFCVYESGKDDPGRPPLQDTGALRRLDPDFMGVMPSAGGALDDALSKKLIEHFQSQAGAVALPILPGRPQTRLAVLDTAPTVNTGAENTSVHGFTLIHLARGLLCNTASGQCVTRVTSRLAMGWECFDGRKRDSDCRNPVNGGLYGLAGELARAIHLEMHDWQIEDPDKRLVMNLSTGWDPVLGGLEPLVDMPAPALAVYSALEEAVCAGAVVMAAAGNRTGGPTDEIGPILPAAWETHAGPTPARCQDLGVAPMAAVFPAPGASPYRTLVTAVGGVDADDRRLANRRVTGEPRLVAFGDHGKGLASGTGVTATLTGTSVSTLVASAAAAAAWYYDRGREPYEIPALVYDGGRSLGRTSNFCQGTAPCATVHRASVCDAVVAAGGLAAGTCAPAVPLSLAGADLSAFLGSRTTGLDDLQQRYAPIAACRDERGVYEQLRSGSIAPVDPCPHWQYDPRGPARSTQPQPGAVDAICSTCALSTGSETLYIAVDGDFEGIVEDGTFKCGEETFSLGLPEMGAGDTWLVTDVDCLTEPAQISFTVDGDTSATSPILVVP